MGPVALGRLKKTCDFEGGPVGLGWFKNLVILIGGPVTKITLYDSYLFCLLYKSKKILNFFPQICNLLK